MAGLVKIARVPLACAALAVVITGCGGSQGQSGLNGGNPCAHTNCGSDASGASAPTPTPTATPTPAPTSQIYVSSDFSSAVEEWACAIELFGSPASSGTYGCVVTETPPSVYLAGQGDITLGNPDNSEVTFTPDGSAGWLTGSSAAWLAGPSQGMINWGGFNGFYLSLSAGFSTFQPEFTAGSSADFSSLLSQLNAQWKANS